MTLSEETAILLEAVENELLQPEDIVRWADQIIVAMEQPPGWIIELSMLGLPHLVDFVSRLREQEQATLSSHCRIQIVVLAYNAGSLTFSTTLPKLFRIVIFDRAGRIRRLESALDERLKSALVTWDCQEDLDVIEQPLQAEFTEIFQEYLKNTAHIVAMLPWKFKKADCHDDLSKNNLDKPQPDV
jgi:hypothetical protein